MLSIYRGLGLLMGILLVGPLAAEGKSPLATAPKEVRREPLPDGALLRLDGVRMEHKGVVRFAFSPDGRSLASAGGGVCHLWDLETGREIRRYPPPDQPAATEGPVFSVAGTHVALGRGGEVWIVELFTGRETARVPIKEVFANHSSILALGPGGKLLVRLATETGYGNPDGGTVHDAALIDAAGGKEIRQLSFGYNSVVSMTFSPDGKQLGWAEHDRRRAGVFDVASGKRLRRWHSGENVDFDFGPGDQVAIRAGGVRVCELASDEVLWSWGVPSGSSGYYPRLAYSPDRTLIAANTKTSVFLLDASSGKARKEIKDLPSQVRAIGFSPDGKKLAIGSDGGELRVWDLVADEDRTPKSDPILDAISFVGPTTLLARSKDGLFHIDAAANGKEGRADRIVKSWDIPIKLENSVLAPCGTRMAAHDPKQSLIQLWDTEEGREIAGWGLGGKEATHLQFSPDGRYLAAADFPAQAIFVWDAVAGKQVRRLPQSFVDWDRYQTRDFKGLVFSPALSPSERDRGEGFLICLTPKNTAVVWELASGQVRVEAALGDSKPSSRSRYEPPALAVSPDGRWLAAVTDGTAVRVWDLYTGEIKRILAPRAGWLRTLALSPGGTLLATAGADGVVALYDLKTGEEKRRFSGHRRRVNSVVFSPDARMLVSSGDDATMLFWNVDAPITEAAADIRLETLWTKLAAKTFATAAHEAIADLTRQPDLAIPFLKKALPREIAAAKEGSSLRLLRVVEVLEGIGGKEGMALLTELANCEARVENLGSSIGEAARDALARLRWGAAKTDREPRKRGEDLPEGALRRIGTPGMGHRAAVRQLAFTPDGKLASTGEGRDCIVWDLKTGREAARFPAADQPGFDEIPLLSPDGGHVALEKEKVIRVVDLGNGRETGKAAFQWGKTAQLALAPGGKRLVRLIYTDLDRPVTPNLIDASLGGCASESCNEFFD